MKSIRKIAKNPMIVSLMCTLILFISCNSNNESQAQIGSNISGEELFRSIVFVDGELTNKIPTLKTIDIYETLETEEQIKEYRLLQQETIDYINDHHPKYFDGFKEDMLSKDPNRISQSLASVKDYLIPFANEKLADHGLTAEEVINEYKNADTKRLKGVEDVSEGKCLYEAIVIVAVGAVAIALYAWAAVARWETVTYPEEEIAKAASLYNEELSISIAENL